MIQWTVAVPQPDRLGESPFWHQREQVLYWVDIPSMQLRRCDTVCAAVESWQMPSEPGCIAPAQSGGLSDNSAAAIAYITIIPAIIFLVMEPYNRKPFVRYHAMQCIGLHVLWLAVWLVLMVLGIMLAMVHLHMLVLLLWPICWIGLVVLWLLCIVSAAQGKWFKLPIIGDFARKQAGA